MTQNLFKTLLKFLEDGGVDNSNKFKDIVKLYRAYKTTSIETGIPIIDYLEMETDNLRVIFKIAGQQNIEIMRGFYLLRRNKPATLRTFKEALKDDDIDLMIFNISVILLKAFVYAGLSKRKEIDYYLNKDVDEVITLLQNAGQGNETAMCGYFALKDKSPISIKAFNFLKNQLMEGEINEANTM